VKAAKRPADSLQDIMTLTRVGTALLYVVRFPLAKINDSFHKACDEEAGSYQAEPRSLHPESNRFRREQALLVDVAQIGELPFRLGNPKRGPYPWQKRIAIDFKDE
jgi:hypothetical protein